MGRDGPCHTDLAALEHEAGEHIPRPKPIQNPKPNPDLTPIPSTTLNLNLTPDPYLTLKQPPYSPVLPHQQSSISYPLLTSLLSSYPSSVGFIHFSHSLNTIQIISILPGDAWACLGMPGLAWACQQSRTSDNPQKTKGHVHVYFQRPRTIHKTQKDIHNHFTKA